MPDTQPLTRVKDLNKPCMLERRGAHCGKTADSVVVTDGSHIEARCRNHRGVIKPGTTGRTVLSVNTHTREDGSIGMTLPSGT